jgi:hypothetical protein
MAVTIDILSWCKRWNTIDQSLQKEFLSLQFCHSQLPSSLFTPVLCAVIRGRQHPNISAKDVKQVATSLWSRSRVASPTVVTRTLFVEECIKAYVAIEGKERARVCQAMMRTAVALFDIFCPRRVGVVSNQQGLTDAHLVRSQLQSKLRAGNFGEQQHGMPKMLDDTLALEDLGLLGDSGSMQNKNYGAAFCSLVECFHVLMHDPYYRMTELYVGPNGFLGALVHQLHYFVQLYVPEVNQLLLRVATTCAGDDLHDARSTEELLYLVTHRWFLSVFADVALEEHIAPIWHRFIAFGWKFVLQLSLQILHEALGIRPTPAAPPEEPKNTNVPGFNAKKQYEEQKEKSATVSTLFAVPPECLVDVLSELPANIVDLDATIRRSWFWRPRLGTATLVKLEREYISTTHANRLVKQEHTD